jgi:tRNA A-37 threonylcarbamoyl transferase component Bud32
MEYQIIRSITDKVKLIKLNSDLYILKEYKNVQAKNNTINYIDKLKLSDVKTLNYYNFEFLSDTQLCLEYVNKCMTMDKHRSQNTLNLLANYLYQVHYKAGIAHGCLENNNILIFEDGCYLINPTGSGSIELDLNRLYLNNFPLSKFFKKSLNQQDFKQNEYLETFVENYKI